MTLNTGQYIRVQNGITELCNVFQRHYATAVSLLQHAVEPSPPHPPRIETFLI
jgi:hypothetical protein